MPAEVRVTDTAGQQLTDTLPSFILTGNVLQGTTQFPIYQTPSQGMQAGTIAAVV